MKLSLLQSFGRFNKAITVIPSSTLGQPGTVTSKWRLPLDSNPKWVSAVAVTMMPSTGKAITGHHEEYSIATNTATMKTGNDKPEATSWSVAF
jgi:hypothetical protein